jgi:hypothetical protein
LCRYSPETSKRVAEEQQRIEAEAARVAVNFAKLPELNFAAVSCGDEIEFPFATRATVIET